MISVKFYYLLGMEEHTFLHLSVWISGVQKGLFLHLVSYEGGDFDD